MSLLFKYRGSRYRRGGGFNINLLLTSTMLSIAAVVSLSIACLILSGSVGWIVGSIFLPEMNLITSGSILLMVANLFIQIGCVISNRFDKDWVQELIVLTAFIYGTIGIGALIVFNVEF